MNTKRSWYAIELAQAYEQAAHDLACSDWPIELNPLDLEEFERVEWLAEIWGEISYVLHGKWY